MVKNINVLPLVFSCLFYFVLQSCHDIIEKDISQEVLEIESPSDNFASKNYDVTFWWHELDGGKNYHLQIVQPSFSSVERIIIDTLVVGDRCDLTLYPGKYQWRLRAENNGSSTNFITRTLLVDSNTDFTNQTFTVNSPQDNYVSNSSIVTFGWPSFPFATAYEYMLCDTVGNIVRSRSTSDIFIWDTLSEGRYQWKVRALNDINGSATLYSVLRNLIIDVTAPPPSLPTAPANNSIDSNGLSLEWNRLEEVYADSLFVASDSNFSSIVAGAYLVSNTSYHLQLLPINHTYYWRLRSRDYAGNWSVYSSIFRFAIVF